MRHKWVTILAASVLCGCAESAKDHDSAGSSADLRLSFEHADLGTVPPGFITALTGQGGPGAWAVTQDPDSPAGSRVLRQTSEDATRYRFPLCIYEGLSARDVEVSVAFRPVSGQVDQAAGIVWRYRDPDHYYVARANALENNVVLYKVEAGKRTDLKIKGGGSDYGVKAPVPKETWSQLKVRVVGDTFTVFLNNRRLFEVQDSTYTTAGKVGLWTKADSVTSFDDFVVTVLDK